MDKADKAAANRAWKKANPENVAASKRKWRQANKERLAEQQRVYRATNKERLAVRDSAYRETNKERLSAYGRAWRQANPAYPKRTAIVEARQAYYEANKDKLLANDRRWKAANPDKVAAYRRAADRKARSSISDRYVCYALWGIRDANTRKAIPPELIEAKRVLVKIKREVKQQGA